jgi:hypothetical protein
LGRFWGDTEGTVPWHSAFWEDLEEIRAQTGVHETYGDVLNLMRRSRDPMRQVFEDQPSVPAEVI